MENKNKENIEKNVKIVKKRIKLPYVKTKKRINKTIEKK